MKVKLLLLFLMSLVLNIQNGLGQKHEIRGVWISSVSNLDWPSSKNLSPDAQRKSFIDLLDILQQRGINAIFMQIRPSCDALYPSQIEPWSEWLTGSQGRAPQPFYDPLQFMIDEAQNRGMEFHAWLNPFRAVVSVSGSSVAENHISKTHPQWIITYGNLKILNPGIPDARAHIIKVVMDIVRRYPVDGIHFDDYFYPYPQVGQTINDATTFQEFNRNIGSVSDWRRDNINIFIKDCRDSIKAFDKRIKYGVSPFGIWRNRSSDPSGSATNGLQSFNDIFADSKKWVESGWLDYVVPQIYWAFGFSAAAYDALVPWWASLSNPHHLYIGHGVYRLDPSSTTIFSHAEIPNQIKYNRNIPNVQGSLFFRAGNLRSNFKGISDSLQLNMYKYAALRAKMPWLDNIAPEAPTMLTLAHGDGKVSLNWVRSGQASDGEYARQYAIYRFKSTDKIEITNPENLIHITPKDVNKYDDVFPVDQNQSYTYIVTALDRLHNESPSTNMATIQAKLTSLHAEWIEKIKVYPNPVSERLMIDFRTLSTLPNYVEIINSQGHVLYRKEVSDFIEEVDVSHLVAGIYFVNIDNSVKIRVLKN
jgi:uncharacterized lipoprotein YddW (UPF0748 family)